MERPGRYADEVSCLDFDGDDRRVLGVNVKDPFPRDDEADFVLVVPVLAAELREHRVEPGRRGRHVDDVGGDVAAARPELRELALVRFEDARGRCRRDLGRDVDALVVDPDRGQLAPNVCWIGHPAPLGGNPDGRHSQSLPRDRPTTSNRNSRISTCRMASGRSRPHV